MESLFQQQTKNFTQDDPTIEQSDVLNTGSSEDATVNERSRLDAPSTSASQNQFNHRSHDTSEE